MVVVTGLILVPVLATFILSLRLLNAPPTAAQWGFDNFALVFGTTDVVTWLVNQSNVSQYPTTGGDFPALVPDIPGQFKKLWGIS